MNDDEVIVTLQGDRARGRYALFQTDGKNWMIHRMDPPEDPDREPLPKHIDPMLATLSKSLPPDEDNYAFEVKWDGVRSISYVEGGRRGLFESRRGGDITPRYPELRGLGPALSSTAAVLDGEIVAFEGERPSFERLQRRMHVSNERAIRRLMGEVPVVYVIFDLLWLEGPLDPSSCRTASAGSCSTSSRRKGRRGRRPPRTKEAAPHCSTRPSGWSSKASSPSAWKASTSPAVDHAQWLKVKNHNSQEFVIGGWAAGKGGSQQEPGRAPDRLIRVDRARRAAEIRRPCRHRAHRDRAAAAGRAARALAPGHEPVLARAARQGRGVRRARARRRG